MVTCNKISPCASMLVAIIIIFISFGYLFLFYPAKVLIKQFVQYSIENREIDLDEMSILVFNLNDLNNKKYDFVWVKTNKEFRFKRKMYDVEKKEVKGDSIYFTCYYDHKENMLEEIFALFFKNNKNDKTHNYSNRLTFVGLYSEDLRNIKPLINNFVTILHPYVTQDGAMNHFKDVLTPPPRLIS